MFCDTGITTPEHKTRLTRCVSDGLSIGFPPVKMITRRGEVEKGKAQAILNRGMVKIKKPVSTGYGRRFEM
jgi:hypothetical protein